MYFLSLRLPTVSRLKLTTSFSLHSQESSYSCSLFSLKISTMLYSILPQAFYACSLLSIISDLDYIHNLLKLCTISRSLIIILSCSLLAQATFMLSNFSQGLHSL